MNEHMSLCMLVCQSSYKAVKEKKSVCIDSFGTAALGNGSWPESTASGPRLSEEYQMLMLDIAPSLLWFHSSPPCSLPPLCQVDADSQGTAGGRDRYPGCVCAGSQMPIK